jgi:hypothetical protein
MRELNVAEQRYQAVLALISDGSVGQSGGQSCAAAMPVGSALHSPNQKLRAMPTAASCSGSVPQSSTFR